MIPAFLSRQGWRVWHLPAAVLLAAAAMFVTRAAWLDIVQIGQADEEQSHVFLAPLVAVWMVWVRRARLRHCPPRGAFLGPLIVAAGFAMWHVGFLNAVQSLWHAGAVAVVVGAAVSVTGSVVMLRFLPALAVLAFLVPIPGAIRSAVSMPLQTASAATTQALLEILGVGVERSGNLLTINGAQVAVAEACNGMRMVFASVLVTYAFCFGTPLRTATRLIVLALSPLAALACNVARLVPTVLLYGYSSKPTADGFHDLSGWLMLPLVFVLLMGVIRVLRWALIPVGRYTLAYQ